jgi:uncharacterized protein YjbI with pentapeptide repeats
MSKIKPKFIKGSDSTSDALFADGSGSAEWKERFKLITEDVTLFCSPQGDDVTGSGTALNPFYSPHKVLELLEDRWTINPSVVTIVMLDGEYTFYKELSIENINGNRIVLRASDLDKNVVFNFYSSVGISLDGNKSINKISGIIFNCLNSVDYGVRDDFKKIGLSVKNKSSAKIEYCDFVGFDVGVLCENSSSVFGSNLATSLSYCGVFALDRSSVYLVDSEFQDKEYCVQSKNCSFCDVSQSSLSCEGFSNGVGCYALRKSSVNLSSCNISNCNIPILSEEFSYVYAVDTTIEDCNFDSLSDDVGSFIQV